MKTKEIVEALGPWLTGVRRPAWKPVLADGENQSTDSKFGGLPWIGPEAPWPECRVCGNPLTLFLQLDLFQLPEGLGDRFGTGLLQLFYCIEDGCQGHGGWEPFGNDLSQVRVVYPTLSGSTAPAAPSRGHFPTKWIVGWIRFDDLPSPGEHDDLGLKSSYDFEKGLLRLECPELGLDETCPIDDCPVEDLANSEGGDKLAGWPAWVQGVEYPTCPRCGRRMVPLFQVDSEDNIPFMFGDCGCGHVTQCPEHKEVVAFGWACS